MTHPRFVALRQWTLEHGRWWKRRSCRSASSYRLSRGNIAIGGSRRLRVLGANADSPVPEFQQWLPPGRGHPSYEVSISRRKGPADRLLPDATARDRTECADTVGGRPAVIVSYQMLGVNFDGTDRYAIDAMFQLDPTWVLQFGGRATPRISLSD